MKCIVLDTENTGLGIPVKQDPVKNALSVPLPGRAIGDKELPVRFPRRQIRFFYYKTLLDTGIEGMSQASQSPQCPAVNLIALKVGVLMVIAASIAFDRILGPIQHSKKNITSVFLYPEEVKKNLSRPAIRKIPRRRIPRRR